MKTNSDRPYIEASIIGDSHSMVIRKSLAARILFRNTMSAPAKHFDGRFFVVENGVLHVSDRHLREAFPRVTDDTIDVFAKARARLDMQLQALIGANLPVISSLGSASYRFARRVTVSDPLSGQTYPSKLFRAAAAEHVEHFIRFHEELLKRVPSVAFVIGPCRYPEREKTPWLAYDKVLIDRLSEIGVTIIDVRSEVGDTELRLLPQFEANDIVHGNDKWAEVVALRIFDFIGYVPSDNQEPLKEMG